MEMKRKDSNDILQNQQNNHTEIDFTTVPPLESIAIVKVVMMLCSQPDVRDAMMEHARGPYSFRNSGPILKTILNKLPLLSLPNLIKTKVSPVITPIAIQIIKWISCLCTTIGYDILDSIGYSTLDSLCWTSQGIVDPAETLKQLIEANYDSGLLKCEEATRQIYELACKCCLEDNIPSLWEKLAEETKVHYLNGSLYENVADKHLIAYWSYVNNNELSRLSNKIGPHLDIYNWQHSICKNMFSLALHRGNILAVKYFWDKLTPEEIMCNLEEWISRAIKSVDKDVQWDDSLQKRSLNYIYYQCTNYYADILYFLLSKVSAKTQREVIQKNSREILLSLFLYWPYQRFLLPTIQTVWESLDEVSYLNFLYAVAKEIFKDKASETILKELCCRSSINLQQYFIHDSLTDGNRSKACFVLSRLLAKEDMKTVKKMITYANAEEKKQIAEETISFLLFSSDIIDLHKLNVIDKFFQGMYFPESDIVHLKNTIGLKNGSNLCYKWFTDNNWNMVEKFLNWVFISQEQIDYFKYEVMNSKMNITYQLIKQGYYEFVNQFVNWCCCSEQEINQFKKKFALSNLKIVLEFRTDWCLFEKFLVWSSLSEQEINDFKLTLMASKILKRIIAFSLSVDENFQFVDKLINWCCHSNEEIQHYKEEYILSIWFIDLVFVFDNNWEVIKKLFNLFSPISQEVKIKFKASIAEDCFTKLEMEDLFRLLDGDA